MTEGLKPLLVVLDLDETLFHSTEDPVESHDFRVGKYRTQIRPGAQNFVRDLLMDPELSVAVWTSASEDYALSALPHLGLSPHRFEAVFSLDHCVKQDPSHDPWSMACSGEYELLKDLRKLSKVLDHPLERMIAIDDNRAFYQRQYSNLLWVDAFEGEEDQPGVFEALRHYIETLKPLENVRPVEKRRWFEEAQRALDSQDQELAP